jgi:hypothetical protein
MQHWSPSRHLSKRCECAPPPRIGLGTESAELVETQSAGWWQEGSERDVRVMVPDAVPGERVDVVGPAASEDVLDRSSPPHADRGAAEGSVDEGADDVFVGAGHLVEARAGLAELEELLDLPAEAVGPRDQLARRAF